MIPIRKTLNSMAQEFDFQFCESRFRFDSKDFTNLRISGSKDSNLNNSDLKNSDSKNSDLKILI